MKKYFLKIFVSSLILPVTLATVLCCNFSKTTVAEASGPNVLTEKVQKAKIPCHCHNKSETSPKNNCCKSQLQADFQNKISLNITQTILRFASLSLFVQQQFIPTDKFNLAYLHGPPGSSPIIEKPSYISFYNFRI